MLSTLPTALRESVSVAFPDELETLVPAAPSFCVLPEPASASAMGSTDAAWVDSTGVGP
ncbi:hypothetical protein [Bifidobacterium pseudolongum]|uniref:hypothetical protein n=1 Tax=Bifidobacterium pseudolongum TaxID=1694 RepID=UPI0013EA458D|nr:hypothetical protein [Bifidobacterium pseudolongum]